MSTARENTPSPRLYLGGLAGTKQRRAGSVWKHVWVSLEVTYRGGERIQSVSIRLGMSKTTTQRT